ncbi:MAG TPA: alpha-1,4-glucan--maltose-1-phosphate maltosyltransferase [Mycobacteriales bacterium]|nr:alpha-1,4-glucan--maltose-1-phosphate maltosyltransferase [Mycobacteriales bacterium]
MIGRIPISQVGPVVECGRWPAKAAVGERVTIAATVFREGHDAVAANAVLVAPDGKERAFNRMHPVGSGTDRWQTEALLDAEGDWTFRVEAWSDPVATWRHDAEIKIPLDQDVDLVCEEGARLHERAVKEAPKAARQAITKAVTALRDTDRSPVDRIAAALEPDLVAVIDAHPVRDLVTASDTFRIRVERERARFSAWYEFFPRSEGAHQRPDGSWVSGTLRTAAERLPAVAGMGFDVVYLPPIHPIGTAYRKGPNSPEFPGGKPQDIGPHDPGSPWAIGAETGGHDAIHPDLGTFDDFDAFVATAKQHNLEVALDLALQCSPDHPWVKEHPEWFTVRADGTIAYAENPPKKYQDIYPLNFDNDPEGLSQAVLGVVNTWIDHGVTIFRVDNPHTKPVAFWEWLIGEVRRTHPEVIWLSEAFTKPAMMHMLGKIGFTQSYTYFTWRNERWELEEYLTELSQETVDFLRPNFFVNTPDILHAFLQYGGPPAFHIRAILAALLSPSWGVYSGFELYEHVAVKPGSEEYQNSEKYSYRPRDWAAAERDGRSLAPLLTELNRIRHAHPALRHLRNLRWHQADNDQILAWSKKDGDDCVLVVVNLDPHAVREATLHIDMAALGFEPWESFEVHDELSGNTWTWGENNYVRLDPFVAPAHVFVVRRGTQ